MAQNQLLKIPKFETCEFLFNTLSVRYLKAMWVAYMGRVALGCHLAVKGFV